MRLALLSNVTVDFLAGLLRKEHDVYIPAGYDSWQREALDASSDFYSFKPEAVVILIYAAAFDDAWESREVGESLIQDWLFAIRAITEAMPSVPVLVSSLDIDDGLCKSASERRLSLHMEETFDNGVSGLHSKGASAYVLPIRDLVREMGSGTFYSSKMWYLGSMPWSNTALKSIAKLVLRYAKASKGGQKKCLAVDLDNTLWGGVIGEDGVNGIVLSASKEGARYRDTQRMLKRMRERGVMLAMLSKNNPEDVDEAFSHPSMVLNREDFAAEEINWDSKAVNIRHLANDLNIGLDSFVFLDDNPAEREAMRAECPEVTVLDFPRDTSLLPHVLVKAYEECFFALDVTGEDLAKTEMYRTEMRRKAVFRNSTSVHDYLANLGMRMDLHPLMKEELSRATQLANKTNQFNVTTIRYDRGEIEKIAGDADSDVYAIHMSDKFGDQGLVALIVIRYDRQVATIESFLMSCRVMGRDAEVEIAARLRRLFESREVEEIRATYVRSAKNEPVSDLFERLGFELVNANNPNEIGGSKQYVANVASLPDATGLFDRTEERPHAS